MTMTYTDPRQVRPTVPVRKAKELGTVGPWRFFEYRGTEFMAPSGPVDPLAIVGKPGQIVLTKRVTESVDGTPWEHEASYVAEPVPAGTHAKAAADAGRRRARFAPQPITARPLDLLAGLAVFHRSEPTRFAISANPDPLAGAMATAAGLPPVPVIEAGGHEAVEPDGAGMLAYLRGRGVELSLSRGRLIVRARQPMPAEVRELLTVAEPLLVGHLSGEPARCALCDAAAVTMCFPSVPMCARHAAD